MKKNIFPLVAVALLSLASCKKNRVMPSIKQYDETQITNYIAANHLTGFQKDTTGGDTSGIYYKILVPGSGTPLQYSTQVAFVYTVRTLDGTYVSSDTIANHFYDYVGHLTTDNFPQGLQTAIHNLLVYPNASIRVLIPSHLAYGTNGTGSGSSQVANNRIGGNECLDYYIHAVNDFPAYDDMVINNYMNANSLTGYTKTSDGLYYKILTPGTGTDPITMQSVATTTYTGQIFNGTIFDAAYNGTNTFAAEIDQLVPGVQEGLINYAVTGTKISLLIPSTLGYGTTSQTGIPPFSCLRFTWVVTAVSP